MHNQWRAWGNPREFARPPHHADLTSLLTTKLLVPLQLWNAASNDEIKYQQAPQHVAVGLRNANWMWAVSTDFQGLWLHPVFVVVAAV